MKKNTLKLKTGKKLNIYSNVYIPNTQFPWIKKGGKYGICLAGWGVHLGSIFYTICLLLVSTLAWTQVKQQLHVDVYGIILKLKNLKRIFPYSPQLKSCPTQLDTLLHTPNKPCRMQFSFEGLYTSSTP